MNKTAHSLIQKAKRAVEAAQMLLTNNYPEFATGRAYYAMFYAAEALLEEKNLRFSKHSGVHAAFGEYYAKTNVVDPQFHRWLLNAYDMRIEGDYGTEVIAVKQDAEMLIEQAKVFIATAEAYLKKT